MDVILIIAAFAISLVCGVVAIPLILDFCKSKCLYDIPNARKVHKSPIPRLGGVSFMPSMLLAFIIAVFLLGKEHGMEQVQVSLWSLYFLVGLLLIYATGVVDDLIGLSANIKFVVQILAAVILPISGLYINTFDGLFGLYAVPYWVGAPLTVFIIVFVCNAMNLIDGIDGLSASLSEMALAGFLVAFYRENLVVYCVLVAGLMGVLLAYLYFNMFGQAEQNRKIFDADKNHIHHKLMRLGLTMHQTLFVILGIALAFLVINYVLHVWCGITVMLVADIVLYTALSLAIDALTPRQAKRGL